VAFDRDGTLRKAEKLLRQGKLDLAIAEYRAVIEDQPSDLNTANTLGDLYYRSGQVDKAVAEYGRIADYFANEGFLPKAVALYKKILKIKPDEERVLWHLGGISARQGLLVDARANFTTLAQRRKARGDRRGEAEVRVKLGDLDGADVETRLAGARGRVELGQTAAAVHAFTEIAASLEEAGKPDDALNVLTEASKCDPQDADLNRLLMQRYVSRGDLVAARQYAVSADELKSLAEALFGQGRENEALEVLSAAAEADPADVAVRSRIAKLLVARGDIAGARVVLTPEIAGSDPELLWMLAEMELRDGHIAEGTAALQQILADDPSRRDALVILGCSVAEVNVDAGFECIEVAAHAAIAADEWGSAAAAFNEFVNRVPNHIPALMRLVEICVDGGLEATMYSAQAQLADAYLVAGAGVEARVIAEDLVAREPWDRANIERFRRALTLLGEADVDAIIADRLSGQSPFTSTDFLWPAEPAGTEMAPMADREPVAVEPPGVVRATPGAAEDPPAPSPFSLGDNAIDLGDILEQEGEEPPAARSDMTEVDLSGVLQDLRAGDPAVPYSVAPGPSLENVLKGIREEAAHDTSPETAEQHYKLADSYIQMGKPDDAIKALEVASKSIRHRFRAGVAIARLHLDRGERALAIDWYERAAEAPAPDPESANALLYDLATALEAEGEPARALAVLMELQSEVGEYRDVTARLERLALDLKAKGS
jgi:tetratricopeptide (TPR) repeat protein